MPHSISAVILDDRFIACGIRSLRSRYCIARALLLVLVVLLCATSVFFVSLVARNTAQDSTTESPRTQRWHRGTLQVVSLVQGSCVHHCFFGSSTWTESQL